jgi:ABC-2 type transport system permease protein
MISDYVSNATEYISTELDESKYKEYYLLLEKRKLEKSIFEDKYRLDNNLDSIGNNTAIAVFINNTCTAIIMLIIYMLMISGSIVSEEFNKGTIKQLLVRPYSRKKIIISKFLSTLIVSLLFLLFYILVCFIFCGITYGFKSYLTPIVIYNFTTKSVTEMSLLKYLIINTITYIPEYLILIALSFFLGTFILNEALAIGIPVMVLLVSSFVLEYTGLRFLKYFPTICWNFNDFLWGGLPTFEGLTLIVNIIVCLITFIILFMGSISVFKNKDIKNQ